MFETINSQVQQNQQALRGAFADQIGRLTAVYEEIGRLEEAGLSLANATIDGSNEWLKKSVVTGEKLRASARQSVKETAAQTTRPLPPLVETFGAFRRFAEENAARMTAYGDEVARLEHEGSGRVTEALDEYARLLKESLRYGAQMAAEWRKLAVEAAKRTAESMTPGA
jgi:hypothetical protein